MYNLETIAIFKPSCGENETLSPDKFPFYYPKVKEYRFIYEELKAHLPNEHECNHEELNVDNEISEVKNENGNKKRKLDGNDDCNNDDNVSENGDSGIIGTISIEIVPFVGYEKISEKEESTWQALFKKLSSWGVNSEIGYKKKVEYDTIFPKEKYQEVYQRLKEKYSYWTKIWTESTDPIKFVFEDIGIASYIICLWELEQKEKNLSKVNFFLLLSFKQNC